MAQALQYLDDNGNPVKSAKPLAQATGKVYLNPETGEPLDANQTPTPAATPPPVAPTGSIRPLTQRERFSDPDLYPVGLKGEGIGENVKNLAQRGGVGMFQLADMIANPGQTVRSFVSSVLPDPIINLLNKLPGPASGKSHPIPTGTPNPLQQAYQAANTSRGPVELMGKAAPTAGQALAGDVLGAAAPAIVGDTISGVGSGAEGLARAMTDTGRGPVERLVKDTQAENKTIDAVNADRTQAHQKDVAKIEQGNTDALRAHNQKIGQTIQQRRAVAAADQARSAAAAQTQVYGSQLIYGLRQLDKALRDRAGVMYDAVREKVGEISRPGTGLASAAQTSLQAIKGTSETPKVFRDIAGKYPVSSPEFIEYQGAQIPRSNPLYDVLVQHGVSEVPPVTFADLQGYYSELGSELSKGTLPSDVYLATRALQDSVGNMMQDIAKEGKVNNQFIDARKFYREYMDTFHEPTGPSSSGSPVAQALLAKDPLTAVSKFSGNAGNRGISNLRKYSDSLANLAQRAGAIKRETSAATASAPRIAKSIVDIPSAKIQSTPTLELKPNLTISTGDIHAARQVAAEASAGKWWRRGEWAAAVPIFQAMRGFWGGHIPSIPIMGLESAGVLATTRAAAELLRYPPMVRFLTQARPEDIALIPPELRGDLPGLVSQARKQGIKVAPALMAAAAGTGQPNRPSLLTSPASASQGAAR